MAANTACPEGFDEYDADGAKTPAQGPLVAAVTAASPPSRGSAMLQTNLLGESGVEKHRVGWRTERVLPSRAMVAMFQHAGAHAAARAGVHGVRGVRRPRAFGVGAAPARARHAAERAARVGCADGASDGAQLHRCRWT